jgi:hypothetical protein
MIEWGDPNDQSGSGIHGRVQAADLSDFQLTKESVRLLEQRTKEYVKEVLATRGQ